MIEVILVLCTLAGDCKSIQLVAPDCLDAVRATRAALPEYSQVALISCRRQPEVEKSPVTFRDLSARF